MSKLTREELDNLLKIAHNLLDEIEIEMTFMFYKIEKKKVQQG